MSAGRVPTCPTTAVESAYARRPGWNCQDAKATCEQWPRASQVSLGCRGNHCTTHLASTTRASRQCVAMLYKAVRPANPNTSRAAPLRARNKPKRLAPSPTRGARSAKRTHLHYAGLPRIPGIHQQLNLGHGVACSMLRWSSNKAEHGARCAEAVLLAREQGPSPWRPPLATQRF